MTKLTVADAERLFADRLSRLEPDLDDLDARSACDAVLEFYREVRFGDVVIEDDGDSLLFQWGIYDWGNGPSFEFDLTRQFIVDDELDDDAFYQLSLTLRYDASIGAEVARGNKWCHNPNDLDDFRDFVVGSQAYAAASGSEPMGVTLTFGPAG